MILALVIKWRDGAWYKLCKVLFPLGFLKLVRYTDGELFCLVFSVIFMSVSSKAASDDEGSLYVPKLAIEYGCVRLRECCQMILWVNVDFTLGMSMYLYRTTTSFWMTFGNPSIWEQSCASDVSSSETWGSLKRISTLIMLEFLV